MNVLRGFLLVIFASLSLSLAGCGGGGGGSTSTPASLTGTAATGAPLASATVTVKDSAGTSKAGSTGIDGRYSIDVTGLTPPLLVKVDGTVAGAPVTLYSIGTSTGVVNIHPLTDMIIRAWYETQGTTVGTAFGNVAANPPPSAAQLNVIKQVVENLVDDWLVLAGVDPGNFDLITSPFNADQKGFDGFLDDINISNGVISVNIDDDVSPEYHATLAISAGGTLTSTIEQDLDGNTTFTPVSTTSNSLSGITTSPYAGAWELKGTLTAVGTLCGGGTVGMEQSAGVLIVDANGNFFQMDQDFPGYLGLTGNITADGVLTITAYGDTLLPTGTCPLGTGNGTMSSVNSGTGTLAQGGDQFNLTLTRITAPSPYAGVWILGHTVTAANATLCAEDAAQIGIAQVDGLLIVDALGNFTSTSAGIGGNITNTGSATFTIYNVGGTCPSGTATGTLSGNSATGTYSQGTATEGTWTLTRAL